MKLRTGVVLINLGSPASPAVGDVRRYLREFLSDPYVIDLPAPARWLLLNAVVLPFRPRRSAEAYAKIWTDAGSPLVVHGAALRDALAAALGDDYQVELAMRYGSPSIGAALDSLVAADVARVIAAPLYPQYSAAATGSSIAKLEAEADARPELAPVEILPSFATDPRFITAWAEVARPELEAFAPDYTLVSYHGLPERQVRACHPGVCLERPDCCDTLSVRNERCYRAQCLATTRALAAALGLAPDAHGSAFQSRLGPTRWIAPYTDQRLAELAAAGHRRLAVLCPSFVADCLETLEEIGLRAREQWQAAGGEALHLVPSLNAHPAWVACLADQVRARA